MRDAPLVSVIIPAHNAGAFIGETLRSVLSQTYTRMEVLVVDDGSQDDTAARVGAIASGDARVRLLQQKNQGVAAARNLAIREAGGVYVANIDADDIWFPRNLEKQVACILGLPGGAGVAYAWSVFVDEEGSLTGSYNGSHLEGSVLWSLVYQYFPANASASLIHRDCLHETGGYNIRLREQNAQGCEDWDLHLRLAERFPFCVVPEFLIGYRQRSTGLSADDGAMARSYAFVMEAAKHRHPEIPETVFRWSRSHFWFYLALKCHQHGEPENAVRWLARAVAQDPAILLLRPRTYRLLPASAGSASVRGLARRGGRQTIPARHRRKRRSPGLTEIALAKSLHDLLPAQRLERRRHRSLSESAPF